MSDTNGQTALERQAAAQKKLRAAKVLLLLAKAQLDSDDYFDNLTPEEQKKALLQSMQLGPEILKIENAQMALVVDDVEANAAELAQATKELSEALSEVENVAKLLNAVSKVLGVVIKIMTFL